MASKAAVAALDESFFRVRFDRLTPLEKKYLRAMAELGPGPHRSGDIADQLGRKVTSLGPTRNQLIDRKRTKSGPMKYSTRVKPISYVKANAAELIRELVEKREPLIITQNGEAKAVMVDVATYEQTQETLALLKILALGNREIEEGKVTPAAEVFRRLPENRSRPAQPG